MSSATEYDRTIEHFKTDEAFKEDLHQWEGSTLVETEAWTGRRCPACEWSTIIGTEIGGQAKEWQRKTCRRAGKHSGSEAIVMPELPKMTSRQEDALSDLGELMEDEGHEMDRTTIRPLSDGETVEAQCLHCKNTYAWDLEDNYFNPDACEKSLGDWEVNLEFDITVRGSAFVEARSKEEATQLALEVFRDDPFAWDHDDTVDINTESVKVLSATRE